MMNAVLCCVFVSVFAAQQSNALDWKDAKTIYEFSALDIDSNNVTLDKYRGRVVLVTNVASKWGSTDRNYREFVQLDERYSKDGLSILAFPCNQFANQEPGTNAEIKKFAREKYGAKFDLFAKIDVNGDGAHPLWKWLKKEKPGFLFNAIKWNFAKFLINRDGKPVERFEVTVNPLAMEEQIKKLLAEKPSSSQ